MKFYIFLVLTIFLSYSCTNELNRKNDKLPLETQSGANTVGCLINGKVFLPYREGIGAAVNCFYQEVNGELFFSMSFVDAKGAGVRAVSVSTSRLDLVQGQTYSLNKNFDDDGDFTGAGGSYSVNATENFYTTSIVVGELKITYLDRSKSVVSGSFWFDAVNSDGEVIEIREGRFDWDY